MAYATKYKIIIVFFDISHQRYYNIVTVYFQEVAMDNTKRKKGKSLLGFPSDYCVVDIETTGLSSVFNEIIEISAVRYRNFKKDETFSTLVKPVKKIPSFITRLTGISNSMVENAPDIESAVMDFYNFLGNDIIMGYNVNFDINFLYDFLLRKHDIILGNDYLDVLRFSRLALPQLSSRSQTSVADHYGININGAHRAEVDCEICNSCYLKLKDEPSVIEAVNKRAKKK